MAALRDQIAISLRAIAGALPSHGQAMTILDDDAGSMMALAGFALDGMTRDLVWRFTHDAVDLEQDRGDPAAVVGGGKNTWPAGRASSLALATPCWAKSSRFSGLQG